MDGLTWLDRDPFFAIVESRPRAVREWQHFAFEIDAREIYASIASRYAENPDDESFPSAVRRWYGRLGKRLFVIDVFYDFYPDQCHLQIPYSDTHQFAWQSLTDLRALPLTIRTNQTIGISNDNESRVRSVFRSDDRGFDYPIYDGTSDEDAETLLEYLHNQNLPISYSLGLPEPDINWVAKEIVAGSQVHRARYNSRTWALNVGCRMSKRSTNEFIVYSESPELDDRRYAIRDGSVENAG